MVSSDTIHTDILVGWQLKIKLQEDLERFLVITSIKHIFVLVAFFTSYTIYMLDVGSKNYLNLAAYYDVSTEFRHFLIPVTYFWTEEHFTVFQSSGDTETAWFR